jgi:pimeloyl-ACP methyl ester carboxylesterase
LRARYAILLGIGVVAFAVGLSALTQRLVEEHHQRSLAAFYATPEGIERAEPGTLLRIESLTDAAVPGAASYRILYRTERPDGTAAVSGAMAFVPIAPAPSGGRPILAFAHGTVGQGAACAPSRRRPPIANIDWMGQAIASGFAVVMTDYTGLGTAGPNLFLVGEAEASDVAYSVRALAEVPGADLGDRWTVMGHSQGGHAALWTGQLADGLTPERELVGVAAIAPAAELALIIERQWNTGVGWGIGAEVARSWPVANPGLDIDSALTDQGRRWTNAVAEACLGKGVPLPVLLGLISAELGMPYFDGDPLADPALAAVVAEQTPEPLPRDLPLMVAQGTADTVVLAAPNAELQETWCAAGSNLTFVWLGGVGHVQALNTWAPSALPWLRARFDSPVPAPACDGVPPVAPATAFGDRLDEFLGDRSR